MGTGPTKAVKDVQSQATSTTNPKICARVKLPIQTSTPLLARSVERIDMWPSADTADIFPLIEGTVDRLDRRNRTTGGGALSTWCVLLYLDNSTLRDQFCDSADVLDELENFLPRVLSISRYPSWSRSPDILHLRLKLGADHTQFKALLEAIVAGFQYQGASMSVTGDLDVFWDGCRPQDYSEGPTVLVPDLKTALASFPHFDGEETDGYPGVASKYNLLDVAPAFCDISSEPWVVCAACRLVFEVARTVSTPGETHCCQECYNTLFSKCHACLDVLHKPKLVTVICGHVYCQDCLAHLFRTGLENVHTFPPRCCQKALLVHEHREVLSEEIVQRYLELREAQIQKQTVCCALPKCKGRPVAHIFVEDEWALCNVCTQLTCARCEKLKVEHRHVTPEKRNCPVDDEALLKLAKVQKWSKCPKCQKIVSRSTGCNSMTCHCGQNFCYTCGKGYEKLRTCGCPVEYQGDELVVPTQRLQLEQGGRLARLVAPVLPHNGEWPDHTAVFQCNHHFNRTFAGGRCQGCLLPAWARRQICRTCRTILCDDCIAARAGN